MLFSTETGIVTVFITMMPEGMVTPSSSSTAPVLELSSAVAVLVALTALSASTVLPRRRLLFTTLLAVVVAAPVGLLTCAQSPKSVVACATSPPQVSTKMRLGFIVLTTVSAAEVML